MIAGGLFGFALGIVAGRWGWWVLAAPALVLYVSVGTGSDAPDDWIITVIPAVPFAFIGIGIGIGLRRAALRANE